VTKLASALICCTVLAGTTYGALCKSAKVTPDMMQTLRALIEMNIEADNTLFGYMEAVSKSVTEYTRVAGHFPSGREAEVLSIRLADSLTSNPYKPVQVADTNPGNMTTEPVPQRNVPKVKVVVDRALIRDHVDEFIATNIANAMEEPGAITAVSDGDDVLIVWGAGSDRKTIRDKSGKPRVIISALR
jgi:hypothetical protein